jgi:hypothetical protein
MYVCMCVYVDRRPRVRSHGPVEGQVREANRRLETERDCAFSVFRNENAYLCPSAVLYVRMYVRMYVCMGVRLYVWI